MFTSAADALQLTAQWKHYITYVTKLVISCINNVIIKILLSSLGFCYLCLFIGVSRTDRVRNEEVHRRAGAQWELASIANQRVLRWFGHVERMARRVLMAEVSGWRVRSRLRLGWMVGVKVALGSRGMTEEAGRQCAKDEKKWRALVHK